MSLQTWQETLIAAQVDGAALANSAAATSLLPPAARFTLPANFFSVIGKTLRVRAAGRISTLAAAPGTLTLDVRLGGAVVFNGGAMALNVNAQNNASWLLEAEMVCRSIGNGANATLLGTAYWASRAILGSVAVGVGGDNLNVLPDTAPAVGAGFDSTVSNVLDFFGTFSVGNPGNSITLHQFTLTSMN